MNILLALILSFQAHAGSLAGVTLPDSVSVGGAPCALNGLGLREKYFFDIYVGALYLKTPTHDAAAAIQADEPKRIVMAFVYSEVTAEQLAESFDEGLSKQAGAAAVRDRMTQLNGWMASMHKGDQVVFDYVPGKGTTVSVKGEVKGSLPGADFMRALWTVYLGDHPPTGKLKKGMIGS